MSARTRILLGATAVALVIVALVGVLFWQDEGRQRQGLVADLLDDRGVVDSVVLSHESLSQIRFTDRATPAEIENAWARVLDAGFGGEVNAVQIGAFVLDPYDLEIVAPVVLALGRVYAEPAVLTAREVGRGEVWLEARLPQPVEGAADATPAEGVEAVLPLLSALADTDLPEDLHLVAAHRLGKSLDLVLVERDALADLPRTVAELKRVAATAPTSSITCDDAGCRAG